jgi:hypothetical protein
MGIQWGFMEFNPLRKVCIAIENHHFEEVKQRTKWGIFNSKLLNYQGNMLNISPLKFYDPQEKLSLGFNQFLFLW